MMVQYECTSVASPDHTSFSQNCLDWKVIALRLPRPKLVALSRNKPGHHGLSGGAVAGVVLGVLAAVALGLFLAFFFIKRRKKGGRMPRENGSTFAMPHFGDGEFGRYGQSSRNSLHPL